MRENREEKAEFFSPRLTKNFSPKWGENEEGKRCYRSIDLFTRFVDTCVVCQLSLLTCGFFFFLCKI
jgi:hypothetical protein